MIINIKQNNEGEQPVKITAYIHISSGMTRGSNHVLYSKCTLFDDL